MKFKDLTGETFNNLKVLGLCDYKKNNRAVWRCLCSCGKIKDIVCSKLISGHTKSCGCLKRNMLIKRNTKHNMTKTRFYSIFNSMKQRCYNRKSQYFYCYGGKGIIVCDRWLESFDNFYNDMFESYSSHIIVYGKNNTTIDRIDSNGNYEPDNCRWATQKEQANNKSFSNLVKFLAKSPDGNIIEAENISEFARNNNLRASCISSCLKKRHKTHKGWTFKYV